MFYIYYNNSEALLKVHFLFLKYLGVLVITYTFYNWMVCSSFTLKGRETICRSFLFLYYVLLCNHFDWAGPLEIRLGWIFGHPKTARVGQMCIFLIAGGCCWVANTESWTENVLAVALVASRSKSCTFWSIFVTVVKAHVTSVNFHFAALFLFLLFLFITA